MSAFGLQDDFVKWEVLGQALCLWQLYIIGWCPLPSGTVLPLSIQQHWK